MALNIIMFRHGRIRSDMNNQDKRKAVHLYQFSVYNPKSLGVNVVRNEDGIVQCAELTGVSFPYRKKEIRPEWMDAFRGYYQDKKWKGK